MTECKQETFAFTAHFSRRVEAGFTAGRVSSNGGALLLREADRKINLLGRLAACFTDGRSALLVKHQLPEMLAQRIYGLALGYEDLNNHEQLRTDPLLGLLSGKRDLDEPLAGKSTLNRLELAGRSVRYHKIAYSTAALDRLLTDLYIESHSSVPEQIVLDLDATDIPIYGHQPERFFRRGPHGQVFVRGVAWLLRQLLLSAAVHLRRRSVALRAAQASHPGCGGRRGQ
ncbi:MAG: transposase [Terracidiphilus sp.]|jgi:hypothetical protein